MDKDIALVITEMLIKQDETTEQTKKTNNILREFTDVSVNGFKHLHAANESQQQFNKLFLDELKEIKVAVKTFVQVEERIKALEEKENNLESRLANVERLLKAS